MMSIWFPLSIIGVLFTAFLSNDLYLPSLPLLVREFNVSENLMQATMTAWFMGSMIFQLFMGSLSDVYGRKPILIGSTLLLLMASLLCAVSTHILVLLLGRAMQGAAVSGLMVASWAAIYETYEHSEQKVIQMLGYVSMSTSIAPIIGPILGGYIAVYWHWSLNFYVVALLSLIFLFILWLFISESHQFTSQHSLQWKKICASYKTLLYNSSFTLTIITYGFMSFVGGAFLTSVAFIFVDMLNILPQRVGLFFTPLMISYMIGAGITGHLVNRLKANHIILMALITANITMIIFAVLSFIKVPTLAVVIVPVGIYYLCLGLCGPPLHSLSLSYAAHAKGAGAALLTFCIMAGCTLGSFLVSIFYNGTLSAIAIILCAGVFISMSCYACFLNTRNNQGG